MTNNENIQIGNTLSGYPCDGSLEARKLKAFAEDSMPEGANLSRIELMTYNKLHHRKVQRRIIWSIAASLTLVFVMTFTLLHFQDATTENGHLLAVKSPEYVSIKVPVGDKMTIMLSDGTKIVANSRSEVRYPKTFLGSTRDVYASGEVYFDVAHDKDHPFIVNTNGLKVKVLGTKFCINHYSNNKTEVVLIEGCVAAKTDNYDAVTMHPNQLLQVENGVFKSLLEVDAEAYTSWMDGVLNLHGDDIKTVITRVNDYYGTNIPTDNIHSDTHLYGKLLYQKDVRDVLKSVNTIVGTDFR